MRGLEEIKARNENPHGFHGDSNEVEQFRPSQRRLSSEEGSGKPTNDRLQKILEEITGGRPRAAATTTTDFISQLLGVDRAHVAEIKLDGSLEGNLGIVSLLNKATGDDMTPTELREMAAVATVFDKLGIPAPADYADAKKLATALAVTAIKSLDRIIDGVKPKRDRFVGMDGIHSAIDAKPDFLKFWQKLNEDRAAGGQGEALYKEAKLAFSGGPTPHGALTFFGPEWDGLRAVPAKPHDGHKSYHGEFRSVAAEGNSIWNVVSNTSSLPICYATPEAALSGARHARIHSEAARKS